MLTNKVILLGCCATTDSILFFTDDKVNLPSLLHFPHALRGSRDIITRIASRYATIGILLLHDEEGCIVSGISGTSAAEAMIAIFKEWFQRDVKCSWQKFIDCLRKCGLDSVATDIEDALKPHTQQVITGLLKLCNYLISYAHLIMHALIFIWSYRVR